MVGTFVNLTKFKPTQTLQKMELDQLRQVFANFNETME